MSMNIWSDEGLPAMHFQVTQLLTRYARGVDRRDWGLLRSVFHDDAVDEHGIDAVSVDTFIDGFSRRSAKVTEMMHTNSNILILDRDDDRRQVLVETYCVAWSRTQAADVFPGSYYDSPLIPADSPHARLLTVANRYVDLISERDGELKIQFRRIVFEWATVAEVPAESPFPQGVWTGSRSSTDASYETLPAFRADYDTKRAHVHPDRRD